MHVKSGGPLHTPWPQSSRHLKNHGGGGGELVGAESSKHPTISTHCNTLTSSCFFPWSCAVQVNLFPRQPYHTW